MKKLLIILFFIPLVLFLAQGTGAKTLEFDFENEVSLQDELTRSLPDGIREDLKEDASEYDYAYFRDKIISSLKSAAGGGIKTLASLVVIVIIASSADILSDSLCDKKTREAFGFCSCLCISAALWEVFGAVLDTAKLLLETLSNTMLGIVPVMEGALIYSGNMGSAAVQGTGINLMIALGENVFSKALFPGAVMCFFLAVAATASDSGGIAFMSKSLRGLLTGGLIATMALMSFVLILRSGAASAADTFAARTLKFAISSYIPIVGGTVSESFSCLAGSLAVIKETCGITGIVVIFLCTVPSFLILTANRLAVGLSRALSGALGCKKLENILGEAGSVCTLIIAVCAGAAVMFMIAVGLFCRTVPAIS